jgi:hypothetical protein
MKVFGINRYIYLNINFGSFFMTWCCLLCDSINLCMTVVLCTSYYAWEHYLVTIMVLGSDFFSWVERIVDSQNINREHKYNHVLNYHGDWSIEQQSNHHRRHNENREHGCNHVLNYYGDWSIEQQSNQHHRHNEDVIHSSIIYNNSPLEGSWSLLLFHVQAR